MNGMPPRPKPSRTRAAGLASRTASRRRTGIPGKMGRIATLRSRAGRAELSQGREGESFGFFELNHGILYCPRSRISPSRG